MNEMTTDTRQILGTFFREDGGEPENRPQIALASDEDRAIDLSCRACGALALGAGLGFPVGASAPLRFAPPTSDIYPGRNFNKVSPPSWAKARNVNCIKVHRPLGGVW